MKMKKNASWLLTAMGASLLLIVSCVSDPEPDPIPELEARLTSATVKITRPSGDLRGQLGASGLDLPIDAIQYDVAMYTVEYTTTYGSQEVPASGTVFLPVNGEVSFKFPVLSFQHGTIASNAEAPSQLGIGDVQNLLYSGMAGAGFIVVVPDYIGFGASVDIMHPYFVEEPTANAVVDLIRAGGELALENDLEIGTHLYLAGYSQGGYATMAAHKYIEEQGMEWFELQKSYPSSGGYDMPGVRDYFFGLDVYAQPFFLAYVAEAFRTYYGWNEDDLSLVFNEPYASLIPTLFDASLSGGQINDQLNDTIAVLVQADYMADTEGAAYSKFTEAFNENSLLDWTPQIPVALFHGDADVTVPYQNSVDSYESFISSGTSTDLMTFTDLPGATHFTGFVPYLEQMLNDIVELEGL
jgi:pimeloyl-ACP methyl ester carboxylesterase